MARHLDDIDPKDFTAVHLREPRRECERPERYGRAVNRHKERPCTRQALDLKLPLTDGRHLFILLRGVGGIPGRSAPHCAIWASPSTALLYSPHVDRSGASGDYGKLYLRSHP